MVTRVGKLPTCLNKQKKLLTTPYGLRLTFFLYLLTVAFIFFPTKSLTKGDFSYQTIILLTFGLLLFILEAYIFFRLDKRMQKRFFILLLVCMFLFIVITISRRWNLLVFAIMAIVMTILIIVGVVYFYKKGVVKEENLEQDLLEIQQKKPNNWFYRIFGLREKGGK